VQGLTLNLQNINDGELSLPLPLYARRDLRLQEMHFQSETWMVIKDPLALQYFRMRKDERRVLELLDGTRTLDAIQQILRTEFPARHWSRRDLHELILDFSRRGLVHSIRPGRAQQILRDQSRRRFQRLSAAVLNPFFIRLPGWDPQPFLQRTAPLVRWMFRPWAVLLTVMLISVSWLHFGVQFDAIQRQMPAFFSLFTWPNVLMLWITLGVTKIVHELAHGFACHHFGGECHEIGVAFMVFSPCLYCDVSDSWMLPDRRHRILIAAAGIYIEVLMSAISLFLWSWTQPGLVNSLLLNVFLVTAVSTVIYNANPLLRYDGYYIMSDWLGIPNLRSRAETEIQRYFLKSCFGVDLPDTVHSPVQNRFLFVAYAFCSGINGWVMMLVFTAVLYQLLLPADLHHLALAAPGISLSVGLYRFSVRIRHHLSASGSHSVNPVRTTLTLVLVVLAATAAWTLPLPLADRAPLIVEPVGMRNVYTQVEGAVDQILVYPGETVTSGQPLLRLTNHTLDAEFAELQKLLQKRRVDATLARALNDSARLELALESAGTVEEELKQLQRKRERLTVLSPCNGVVIEASGTELPESILQIGNPLEDRNRGIWLAPHTLLCSIAPDEKAWQAMLYIDHAGREKMQNGVTVSIRLADRPNMEFHGSVISVSPREENFVPASLSRRFGGPVATVTDPTEGRERVASAICQAVVAIEERDADLFTGMQGIGRFEISRPTLAESIRSFLGRTFR
jgi:putative peptide zinc metalloprotease protein